MAPQYPEVTTDYMFVDNAAMKMIQEPKFFDVMVTENTFGDILTDEGSCISGSMGNGTRMGTFNRTGSTLYFLHRGNNGTRCAEACIKPEGN